MDVSALSIVSSLLQNLLLIRQIERNMDELVFLVALQAFPRWPTLKDILLMVKLAYTVAVIQILVACSSLKNIDDDVAWTNDWASMLQHTSLPFLRRATLLVFLFSCLLLAVTLFLL